MVSKGEHHGNYPRQDDGGSRAARLCFDDEEGVPAARSQRRRLSSSAPAELGEQEVREFLLYLVNERKTGSATQHTYVAAIIKFLYTTTLDRPEVVAKILGGQVKTGQSWTGQNRPVTPGREIRVARGQSGLQVVL